MSDQRVSSSCSRNYHKGCSGYWGKGRQSECPCKCHIPDAAQTTLVTEGDNG